MKESLRKYYTLNEAAIFLQRMNLEISLNSIGGYIREKIIKPVIYINSLRVHVCEEAPGNTPRVIASSNVSFYWDAEYDQVVNLYNDFSDYPIILGDHYMIEKSRIIEEPSPIISNWRWRVADLYPLHPSCTIDPKPYSPNLNIRCYILLPKTVLRMDNIMISLEDLCLLQQEIKRSSILIDDSDQEFKSLNESSKKVVESISPPLKKIENLSIKKKSRHSRGELFEYIQKICIDRAKELRIYESDFNRRLWKLLQNEYAGKKGSLITKMEDSTITWFSDKFAMDKTISRHTLENYTPLIKKNLQLQD